MKSYNAKRQYITYKFDTLIQNQAYAALRLPPYHPDFEHIDLIIYINVATKNTL